MERVAMQPFVLFRRNASVRGVCLQQHSALCQYRQQRLLPRTLRQSSYSTASKSTYLRSGITSVSSNRILTVNQNLLRSFNQTQTQRRPRAVGLALAHGRTEEVRTRKYSSTAAATTVSFGDDPFSSNAQRRRRAFNSPQPPASSPSLSPASKAQTTAPAPEPELEPEGVEAPAAVSSTDIRVIDIDNSIVAHAPVELSTEQRFLIDQVIHKKKSVFFTGSAGTGKSVLLRQLIEELKEHYLPGQVAVTASTGIAACNIGGCTLHSFAGVGIGTGTVEQLIKRLDDNKKARGRWKRTKVLIIDEISMVDGELFDKLEQIARKYKRSNKAFGGIQLVITGDFFQLPPVASSSFGPQGPTSAPSPTAIHSWVKTSRSTTTIIKRAPTSSSSSDSKPLYDPPFDDFALSEDDLDPYYAAPPLLGPDPTTEAAVTRPKLCFDAKSWNDCINYTLQLTEVFRQRDPRFIQMLTEMRHGKLSDTTCEIFKQLERTPQYPDDGIQATELFALRRQVDQANQRYLAALPGPVYVYEPRDDGPLKEFMERACMAPSKLQLKENAQVMLIKNLTPTLVNGSMGLVVGFQEDRSWDDESAEWVTSRFPVVRFQGEEVDLVIKPEEWRMELPDGEVMASRIQVPLILAWAMSIHKSQGQTMERLKVDMGKIFEAGQAYVALSRATSLAGLQVLNFNKRSVQAHERVAQFYDGLVTVQRLMEQQMNQPKKKASRRKKALTEK